MYDDLRALKDLFDGNDLVALSVPQVLGWHEAPPSVCVEFIEGEDLSRVLEQTTGESADRVVAAIAECGAALGLFHTAGQGDGDPDKARRQIAEMARKVMVDPSFIDAIDLDRLVTRRYGDFAPYNMRADDAGVIWVLDQPSGRMNAPVHRDVAYFLERVQRRLGGGIPGMQDRLEEAFLASYSTTGPGLARQTGRSDLDRCLPELQAPTHRPEENRSASLRRDPHVRPPCGAGSSQGEAVRLDEADMTVWS